MLGTCEDYTLKACGELMHKARNRLDHGAGVVVLDRLQLKLARSKREGVLVVALCSVELYLNPFTAK